MKLILAGAGVKEGDLSLRAYEEIKKAEESGFIDEADIDWDNLQQYAG